MKINDVIDKGTVALEILDETTGRIVIGEDNITLDNTYEKVFQIEQIYFDLNRYFTGNEMVLNNNKVLIICRHLKSF